MKKAIDNIFEKEVSNYSVNLLWLNKQKDENFKYIHPAKHKQGIINDEQILIDELINPALKWAKENKGDGAKIKIWYDSKLHTKEQIENTKQVLAKLANKEGYSNITLEDINQIDFVQNNKFLFESNMGLYFRIDFLKLIILAQELTKEGSDGAVFSDTKICNLRTNESGEVTGQRFNKAELFHEQYLKKLEEFGIITNSKYGDESDVPENQFIQIINDEKAIDSLRHIINACAMRAVELLNAPKLIQEYHIHKMYNMIFQSTVNEYSNFYRGFKADTIKINVGFIENKVSNDQWKKYNPEQDGYEALGNFLPRESLNFTNMDLKVSPFKKICPINESINFGVNDEGSNIRNCFVKVGRAHENDQFILPEEGHTPFAAIYWQNEEVEVIGV